MHLSSRRNASPALIDFGWKIILIWPFAETDSRLGSASSAKDDVAFIDSLVLVLLYTIISLHTTFATSEKHAELCI
jgi:hypothetical protein